MAMYRADTTVVRYLLSKRIWPSKGWWHGPQSFPYAGYRMGSFE
jgi:hypothetical protein